MKLGLGIDTGGTYTDAVIFDFVHKQVLHTTKTLTTKEDLSLGIIAAIDALPAKLLPDIDMVSLSTTLATNACVEDKGGHAKLVFIGISEHIVNKYGHEYGLPPADDILFVDAEGDLSGSVKREPDWQRLESCIKDWVRDADGIAVVDLYGNRNPILENKVKDLLAKSADKPVICGHELFDDMNSLKRSSSTLLNAQLIPIIQEFLDAVRSSLKQRSIKAPVIIVRSDGSVMSEAFTTFRPVETLLCGPAASVLGGMELTGESDCIVVDMGGTTTDISLVKNGAPVLSQNGASVGKWKTFVRAVNVNTFGLGGDSAIRLDRFGRLNIGPSRVMPLAVAAERWPRIKNDLERQVTDNLGSTLPLHEFFYLQHSVTNAARYSKQEIALCQALENGPLSLQAAAQVCGTDKYSLNLQRLEKEGIVNRCGLTPTDIMHIKGDFTRFNTQASILGAKYVAAALKVETDSLCREVYERIEKTVYTQVVQMLLEDRYPVYRQNGMAQDLTTLIENSWKNSNGFFEFGFCTKAKLIGIGAPTHIFIDSVAKALGTSAVSPKYANVANALGAIVGHVTVVKEVNIKPNYTVEGIAGYAVLGENRAFFKSREEAVSNALQKAQLAARQEATRRGAVGDINVTTDVKESVSEGVCLGISVTATAIDNSF